MGYGSFPNTAIYWYMRKHYYWHEWWNLPSDDPRHPLRTINAPCANADK